MGYEKVFSHWSEDRPNGEQFTLGFEAGRIWALMRRIKEGSVLSEELEGQSFHAENAEMIMRMLDACELEGWSAKYSEDENWMTLRR